MQKLNKREQTVLEYIGSAVRENGYAPSVRDIVSALNYKSTSTVKMYLDRLESYGYIRRENGKSRSITLCGNNQTQGIPVARVEETNGALAIVCTEETLPFLYPSREQAAVAYRLENGGFAVAVPFEQDSGGATRVLYDRGRVCLETDPQQTAFCLGRLVAVIELPKTE